MTEATDTFRRCRRARSAMETTAMTAREQHLAALAALPPATAADDRLIPIARVEQIAGIMRSRIYQLIRQGSFPAPYKPGGFASRWSEAGVRGWVDSIKAKAA